MRQRFQSERSKTRGFTKVKGGWVEKRGWGRREMGICPLRGTNMEKLGKEQEKTDSKNI